MMEKKKPTANCIVARLTPDWGGIVSLLFKTTEPYEHYNDEHREEVPYGAIASWTDVELPPENEDERIRKKIIQFFRDTAKGNTRVVNSKTFAEWADYLEKQKEQPVSGSSEKPSNHKEWSEEDRYAIQVIEHALYGAGNITPVDAETARTWLKFLRPQPHWKPSDEQMNYLCAVVDEAKRRHNISVSGYLPARSLESLYNDLKKLM